MYVGLTQACVVFFPQTKRPWKDCVPVSFPCSTVTPFVFIFLWLALISMMYSTVEAHRQDRSVGPGYRRRPWCDSVQPPWKSISPGQLWKDGVVLLCALRCRSPFCLNVNPATGLFNAPGGMLWWGYSSVQYLFRSVCLRLTELLPFFGRQCTWSTIQYQLRYILYL